MLHAHDLTETVCASDRRDVFEPSFRFEADLLDDIGNWGESEPNSVDRHNVSSLKFDIQMSWCQKGAVVDLTHRMIPLTAGNSTSPA